MYCVIYSKYTKFEKPKIWYLWEKALALSIICSKCKNEDEKIFKEEESIEILKIFGLIHNIEESENMSEENMNQEFRLTKIDEIRNNLI